MTSTSSRAASSLPACPSWRLPPASSWTAWRSIIRDLPDGACCVEPIGLRTMARDTWLVIGRAAAGHR